MLSTKKCNYEKLITYVLESELSLNKINQLTKSHRITIKKNIIKALEIIKKFYAIDVTELRLSQVKKINSKYNLHFEN